MARAGIAWSFALLFLCLCPSALACLNDRDTLAEEARGLPNAVQIITGRFERNPPLFYQMRVARVSAELKAAPARLSLYDDAAVACDRLGQDDAALRWMALKRAALMRQAVPSQSEDWYRYLANDGTARVHRWLRSGGDRKRIAEVVQARGEIARALLIKPDAHFGRERYQLMVMDWIIEPDVKPRIYAINTGRQEPVTLGEYISGHSSNRQDRIQGLLGLIALGGAWESVDVFQALAYSFRRPWQGNLSLLAAHRCAELLDAGQHSLNPSLSPDEVRSSLHLEYDHSIYGGAMQANKDYVHLRADARIWQTQRTTYMMARLAQGRHPDTDPTFWTGWHDPGATVLPEPVERRVTLALRRALGYQGAQFATGFFILLFPVALFAFVFKAIRQRLPNPKGRHEDLRLTRRR